MIGMRRGSGGSVRAVSVRDRSPSSPRTSDEPSWFGRRDGAHRTRETRGEEFRLGGEIRDVRDISVKLTPGEMMLEDLRGRGGGWDRGGKLGRGVRGTG